ncbi:unnamed protein product, partial [Meganyctiphanes norvegica]
FTKIFKSIILQSSRNQPSSSGGKILVLFFSTFVLIIVALYNGSLTSFLAAPILEKVPNTHNEIEDLGYRVWIQDEYAQYTFMKTSPSSTLRNLVQEAIVSDTKTSIPPEDVMQSVQTNKIALMSIDPALVTNTYVDKKSVGGGEYGFCTLRWVTEPLFVTM